MRKVFFASITLTLLILAFLYRKSSLESAVILADLEQVCQLQRSFLETRKLMKHVSENELRRERSQRFQRDIRSLAVRRALRDLERLPAGSSPRSSALDKIALNVGLKNWRCPELNQL